MITVLLLEDEPYTRCFLKSLVATSPFAEELLDTGRAADAIDLCKRFKPEIALLDIELAPSEGMNGIETAEKIREVSPDTRFIFVTGYSQYALDSFVVHPFDYILKPVNKEKLLATLNTLAGKIIKRGTFSDGVKIMIKAREGILYLFDKNIIFVERVESDTYLHCRENQRYTTRSSLTEMEAKLGKSFLRLHRSYIVNLALISKIVDQGNRSFCIYFHDTLKTALMSRYKYERYKDVLLSLD